MPTLQEILAAKKLAQAKATATATATAPAPVPNTSPNTSAVLVPNTSAIVQGTTTVPTESVTVSVAEQEKGAEPVSTSSEPSATTATSTPATDKPAHSEVPQFAKNLADELKAMAQEQDWLDVEQSANSLNEILSVIFDLPYPPDVFIDECVDNAACALEAQKNRYLHDVLNGKKQSGKRQKASGDMSPLQQAVELDKLSDDDIFVFDPLAGIGG